MGTGFRAGGAGHSFSDISFVDGHFLRTDKLSQILPVDPATLKPAFRQPGAPTLVRVEAGRTVRAINSALYDMGLALHNMGGWDEQTAGGVVSTATHGSGLGFGSTSSFVRSLVLVTQDGVVLQIEPTDGMTQPPFRGVTTPAGLYPNATLVQDDEVFQSVVVSMGSMGVIYSVVLDVEPRFWLHEVREISTWEDIIRPDGGYLSQLVKNGEPPPEQGSDAKGETPRYYEIYVNPYATKGGKHTCVLVKRFYRSAPPTTRCSQRDRPALRLVEAIGVAMPGAATDLFNLDPALFPSSIDAGFSGLVSTNAASCCTDDVSFRIFNAGVVNKLRAFSVEPAVDLQQAIPAMAHLHQMAAAHLQGTRGVNAGPISLRFVQRSAAFLAPHYDRATATLEIQTLAGIKHIDEVVRDEERSLMQTFKARPHWGLDLNVIQGEATLRDLYPRFDTWKAQFRKLNSSGVFNNQFTDRVGLSNADAEPWGRRLWDHCR